MNASNYGNSTTDYFNHKQFKRKIKEEKPSV
jgi:hypothetical protein